MLKKPLLKITTLLTLFVPVLSFAATPVGTWKTIDEKTGEAKSLVTISEQDDTLSGTITQILNPANRDNLVHQVQR